VSSVATVLVDGTLELGGGTLSVTSTTNLSTIVTLTHLGGNLDGAATVLLTGSSSTWTGGRMNGTGVTRIASGAVVDITESGQLGVGGSRVLDVRGTLNWDGTTYIMGGVSSALHVGPGGLFDIKNNSSMYLQTRVLSGGTLRKSGGAYSTQIGSTVENGGRIEVLSGTLAVTGPFLNMNGNVLAGGEYFLKGRLRFYGADIVTNAADVTLDGIGAIQEPGGADAFRNLARIAPDASLALQGGRSMTVPGHFTNEGTLAASSGSTFTVANGAFTNAAGGLLQGSGIIHSTVVSAGEVAPGLSPGVLTIDGGYIQQPGGRLRVEVFGDAPGTTYDRLVVTGLATLNGRLTIEPAPRVVLPPLGATFEILTGTRSGQFTTIEGDLLPNGNRYVPYYNPGNVQLVVEPGQSLRRR
jgi:hypothetical protein